MSAGSLLRGFCAAVAAGVVFSLIVALLIPGRRVERVRRLLSRQAIARVVLFGIFYVVAALLSTNPLFNVPSDTATMMTVEDVERATRARMLFEEGISSQPPMVLLLAGVSLFFGRDPLAATLPLQFALYAGLGLIAVELARAAFRFTVRQAAPVAARVRGITDADVRLGAALIGCAVAALILGTLFAEASNARPAENVSGRWRDFDAIRKERFSELTIQLRKTTALDRAFAAYYFPRARVTFAAFTGGEPPPLDAISASTPLFVQHLNCDDVGHQRIVPLPRFGCLLLAPPGVQLERSYPFNRRFLFIDYSGMTRREPGGRWNVGPEMEWRISADPAQTSLDRDLYLNVGINPYLPANVPPHRVMFTFQDGGSAELPLDRELQLSVPVKPGDWARRRLWTLPVRVRFRDGRTMLFQELSLTAQARGVVVQRRSG